MYTVKTKDNYSIKLNIEGKGKTLLYLHGFLGSSDDFRIVKSKISLLRANNNTF